MHARGSARSLGEGASGRTYRKQSAEERREDQYRRLIDAARDVFAEDGYAGSSIDDIVARAHVSRTSFYRFFPDKEACLLAVFRAGFDRGWHLIQQITEREPDPERRLRVGVRGFLEILAADRAMARVVLIGVVGATPAAEQARIDARRQFAGLIETYVHESGVWRGRSEMEIHLVAMATMAGVAESVSYLLMTDGMDDWESAVEPLAAYAVRALTPPEEA